MDDATPDLNHDASDPWNGFTQAHPKNAIAIEKDLAGLFPRPTWTDLAHQLIDHGRAVCSARRPACSACPLRRSCPRHGVDDAC